LLLAVVAAAVVAAAVVAAADQRFKRIVLRSSCMTDHFPAAYKMGLTDVLDSVSKKAAAV
jgi:hypothetical protein